MTHHFRTVEPDGAPLSHVASAGAQLSGPVVMLANVPFHSAWQRCHQLAIGLSEHTDVVYVNPNRSFLQALRGERGVPTAAACPARLHVFTPPPGLPGARTVGLFNRLNYRFVGPGLRAFLGRNGLPAPAAVITTFPDQLDALRHLGEVPLVYDLMDDPQLFLRPLQRRRYARLHREMLARAARVVVSARVLLDRYGPAARSAVWISNGVREELFGQLRTARPSPLLDDLPRPRIGYVGMISHWFDFRAVEAIARSVPTGCVVLVGPTDVRPPKLPPNVVFTGPVPHDRLASVLVGFDVGLIPFVRSRGIDAVNPVKLYEYLAAGLPVLAADFEEIRQFVPLISTYREPAEAAEIAVGLVGSRSPTDVEEGRAFAWGHRWRAKAAAMAAELRSAVGGSEAPAPVALCRAA